MKNFRLKLIIRLLILSATIFLFFYLYYNSQLYATLAIVGIIIAYEIYSIIKFIDVTNKELSRFLQSIKYSDFSQSFASNNLGSTFKELNHAFNEVILQFQKTRTEKEENFRYLQTVMQHVGVGLISFDNNGKVEFINNSAKKLLSIPFLNNISGLERVSAGLSEKIRSIKSGEKVTIKIVDKNELIQLIVYATEFRLRNQNYTLAAMQNIQSELEENEMEAWQKLIRVLTHEIMNSITPISSLAGTVNTMITKSTENTNVFDEETSDDIKNALSTIQKRSQGLINFVENYRSLTKIPKPNFQIFPVKTLIERIDSLMGREFKQDGIIFNCKIEPLTLELTADPELIEQVLINLLLNAKYAVKQAVKPEIDLITRIDRRGKIEIAVTDNGPGIKEDIQEKIFIPFFSTKKEGSGIGLSLSRQIMRSHGGSIRITSVPNEETAFILKF
jgi:two-component system, NtrC family, nitrogen regulation sensor histidine kinase NtrY